MSTAAPSMTMNKPPLWKVPSAEDHRKRMIEQSGWVKPTKRRTLPELEQMIAVKRVELELLEAEASDLREQAKLEAIAKARNIMRAHQLTPLDLE